jgi:hypothetical protein
MRVECGRSMKRLPFIFGLEIWFMAFSAIILPCYLLTGDMPTVLDLLVLLFLPQVFSATAGAFAFVAGQSRARRPGFDGAMFAALTCTLATVGTAVFEFTQGGDQWRGQASAGWLLLIGAALVVVAGVAATSCGYLAGGIAARLRDPGSQSPAASAHQYHLYRVGHR